MEIIGVLVFIVVALAGWAGTDFDRAWLPLVIIIVIAAITVGFFVYSNTIDKPWHILRGNRKTFQGKGYTKKVNEVIEANRHHDHHD